MNKKEKNQHIANLAKDWREKNPEKWNAIQRRYRIKHREEINIRNKKYARKHRSEISIKQKEKYKKWREKNPLKVAKQGTGWDCMRKKALERDNYICQKCGIKDNVGVYHLDGVGRRFRRKDMNNNMNNLITYCHKCGTKTEASKVGNFNKGGFNKRERQRIKKRNVVIYNLSKEKPQSQVARELGLSRQRISQIVEEQKTRAINNEKNICSNTLIQKLKNLVGWI